MRARSLMLALLGTGASLSSAAPPTGHYYTLAETAGRQQGLPPGLMSALVTAESSGDPAALSGDGAIGLTQLMPGTARDLGVNPHDPAQNVQGGARYLAQQLRTFGSLPLALAAYNAGPGRVQRCTCVPPIPETQGYVQRVLNLHAAYTGRPVTATAQAQYRPVPVPSAPASGSLSAPTPALRTLTLLPATVNAAEADAPNPPASTPPGVPDAPRPAPPKLQLIGSP